MSPNSHLYYLQTWWDHLLSLKFPSDFSGIKGKPFPWKSFFLPSLASMSSRAQILPPSFPSASRTVGWALCWEYPVPQSNWQAHVYSLLFLTPVISSQRPSHPQKEQGLSCLSWFRFQQWIGDLCLTSFQTLEGTPSVLFPFIFSTLWHSVLNNWKALKCLLKE